MDNKNDGNDVEEKHGLEKYINDSIKDAIISCARQEVRNLLREIAAPHQFELSDGIYRHDECNVTRRPKTTSPHAQLRKTKSLKEVRRQKRCYLRPSTAHDPIREISDITKNTYDLKHNKDFNAKKERDGYKNICLSSVDNTRKSQGLSTRESSSMSYASSKLLQHSARLINTNDEAVRENTQKLFNIVAKDSKDISKEKENVRTVTSTFEAPKDLTSKEENIVTRHPAATTSINTSVIRSFHKPRPTTALERRSLLSRPSTSHMVRAKAGDFSKLLLDPVQKHEKNYSSNTVIPLPNVMDENEWENELARHIISVFNNKTISDIRDGKRTNMSTHQKLCQDGKVEAQTSPIGNTPTTLDAYQFSQPESTEPPFRHKKSDLFKDSKKLMDNLKPRMIWIAGTGKFLTDWTPLESFAYFDHGANKTLETLAAKGKYLKYIKTVKTALCCSTPTYIEELSESQHLSQQSIDLLWRQLILIVNSFAIKLIQQRKYPQSIDLIETAKDLLTYLDTSCADSTDIVDELNGYTKDSLAYYYSRRDKPSAALKYIVEAISLQKKRQDKINILRCNLHRSFILQQLNRYDEAMKVLKEILKMVDNGSLDSFYKAKEKGPAKNFDNDRQVVLLISVAYHNLCCLQLVKGQIGDACLNSQSCRRLSRLCMNVSSRYLTHFEETHIKAMNELFSLVCPRQTEKEAIVFQRLFSQLLNSTN